MYAFCERGVEGGRHRHPEFHRGELTGRSTRLATGGNGGTQASQKHMISVFELLQLCANLTTMAEWSGGLKSLCKQRARMLWWSSFHCQLPHRTRQQSVAKANMNKHFKGSSDTADSHEPTLQMFCFHTLSACT